MSDERKDFKFYVAGIEDGLTQVLQAAHGGAQGYLKEDVTVYTGPRDEDALTEFISQLAPRFPLMLVVYGEGVDVQSPATSPAGGAPRTFRHNCTFGVICCDDNTRGETDRRRGDAVNPGVIGMLSDARETLGGLQLKKEGALLTFDPLTVAGSRYLGLPGLASYIQDFETYFVWQEPDRRASGTRVTEVIFDVGVTGESKQPRQLPGVING